MSVSGIQSQTEHSKAKNYASFSNSTKQKHVKTGPLNVEFVSHDEGQSSSRAAVVGDSITSYRVQAVLNEIELNLREIIATKQMLSTIEGRKPRTMAKQAVVENASVSETVTEIQICSNHQATTIQELSKLDLFTLKEIRGAVSRRLNELKCILSRQSNDIISELTDSIVVVTMEATQILHTLGSKMHEAPTAETHAELWQKIDSKHLDLAELSQELKIRKKKLSVLKSFADAIPANHTVGQLQINTALSLWHKGA